MKLRRGMGWRGAGVTASQDARGRPSSERGKDLTAGLRQEPHGCGAGRSGQESRSRKGLGPGRAGKAGETPGTGGEAGGVGGRSARQRPVRAKTDQGRAARGPEPFLAVAGGARDSVQQQGTWSDLLVDLPSPVENGLEQKKGERKDSRVATHARDDGGPGRRGGGREVTFWTAKWRPTRFTEKTVETRF